MLKKTLFLFLCLISLTFAATSFIPIYTNSTAVITVSADNPLFIIKLKSNPTTGYSWTLKSYDKEYFKLVRHIFVAPQSTSLIGASGYELWTFQVYPTIFTSKKIHTGGKPLEMEFVYQRPWEAKESEAEKKTFFVTLSPQ